MAIALEDANKVRQKTRAYTLQPMIFHTLQKFFHYWSTEKGNRDLQFIPIADADVTGTDGVVSLDVPATVYVAYIKKGSTATDSYFKLFDDITDDSTTTDARLSLGLLEANESHIVVYPQGLTMATGIVSTSHTNSAGTTDSTAGDSGNGFLIIGAAGSN